MNEEQINQTLMQLSSKLGEVAASNLRLVEEVLKLQKMCEPAKNAEEIAKVEAKAEAKEPAEAEAKEPAEAEAKEPAEAKDTQSKKEQA